MKKWKLKFAISLIILSIILHVIHYFIYQDIYYLTFYLLEDIAFIPIEVLIVSLLFHRILQQREYEETLEKLNMLIGLFFSEIGNELMIHFVNSGDNKEKLSMMCEDIDEWTDKQFQAKAQELLNTKYIIDIDKINAGTLRNFLCSKHDFLISIMQNPSLLEHESFTELLRVVFHLQDELYHYGEDGYSKEDLEHLKIDMERVYPYLMYEWCNQMKHMKNNYPYLFSLALRNNPLKEK